VQDGQNPIHAKSSTKVDHFGWTAGGGLEWEFNPGWTFKTEYLYVDLGEADYNHYVGNKSGAPDVTSSDLDLHVVKAGINYRF
jgi:outer membrane immunogenic protein